MPTHLTEDHLVEQPAIALFQQLGWSHINAYNEIAETDQPILGRSNRGEVVLTQRLQTAIEQLNPEAPPEAVAETIEVFSEDRSKMSLAWANKEVYDLIKNGVPVVIISDDGLDITEHRLRIIDWENPEDNDFLLVSQLWITGEMHTRRPDLIGFVNGLPLVFVELKASHLNLKQAFNNNLRDYKDTIPHLFHYTAIVILSNGIDTVMGSITSGWGHFNAWKKINSEGEEGKVSMETMIRGTCEPSRLLDLIENFTIFMEAQGGLIKIVARNHQYLGVNNAVDALHQIEHNQGRLGVFWHTQGSGKSISMIFFAQKVLRKIPGHWTFVIVTDRTDLDDQIYKNFVRSGTLTNQLAQAESGEDLKQRLREDHRYVFTLIQKFHTERGRTYPTISERSDIIVMTDEAHRSQYDTLALNMRNALPNAAFIGFTGTPLMAGEEKTREVFGDYVSIYNFKQSIDDGATVPLYYENRVPELQLINEDFNQDIEDVLEAAELDEAQEQALEREFAREYHLITRDDRLDTIAKDVVEHFMGRGYRGKAMFIAIDKATAVRMYDKVQTHWKQTIKQLKSQIPAAVGTRLEALQADIAYMEATDMAVVVSQSQNEIDDFRKKGLDIRPHRKRMIEENLDEKFKDEADPFRLVFVCAMWMTGFDVPSCSTIYLDKPMRNHTLMQTIARANRVYKDKVNGLIVDYVGVFRNLQKALAIYGSGPTGQATGDETPVKPKAELVAQLEEVIDMTLIFCEAHEIDLDSLIKLDTTDYLAAREQAVEAILENEETKRTYLGLANDVNRLFKAILPDALANSFGPYRAVIVNIADRIRNLTPPADISEVLGQVEDVLDVSIATEGYIIHEPSTAYDSTGLVDLSQIDFEALKVRFEKGKKRTEAEKLKGQVRRTLTGMVRRNPGRKDYMEKFQDMIDEYNTGSKNIEAFFKELMALAQQLNEEEERAAREGLNEEELAVFDLLMKPAPELTEKERKQVKQAAKDLLQTLKQDKLVLDWRKKERARAAVRQCIEVELDNKLPNAFTAELYQTKCSGMYQHIYDAYWGEGGSIYSSAA